MRQNPPNSTPSAIANPMAGWDIGLAAFALACMTAGFWRLWPGAVSLDDAPLGPFILKAGLAALGFVGVATRWEDVVQAWSRNPLILVLMMLACSSAIWAIVPAEALRNAIMLIVIWVFGIALTLRFSLRELAEICAFAGLFGLFAQFGAHQVLPPQGAFDGDIAFAIIGSAWAVYCVPTRRVMWLLALGMSCALAFAVGDIVSFGAATGLIIGFGLAQVNALAGRQKAVSVIVSAWVIVAMIIGVTLFALFGADPVSAKVTSFFEGLGSHAVIGQGFGLAGSSVAGSLGGGLGIVGVGLSGLVIFATLFQALLGHRQHVNSLGSGGLDSSVAIWFGCLGALVANPADVAMFGPVCIVFAATSFSISLSCIAVSRQPKRQSLAQLAASNQIAKITAPKAANRLAPLRGEAMKPVSRLNEMGLRPKR